MGNGFLRRVDELGRVVLPMELRRELDIAERDLLEVSSDGEQICIRKTTSKCVFCASTFELTAFRGKQVCERCLAQLRQEP